MAILGYATSIELFESEAAADAADPSVTIYDAAAPDALPIPIDLTPVPEPDSAVLCVPALAFLGSWIRRAKNSPR